MIRENLLDSNTTPLNWTQSQMIKWSKLGLSWMGHIVAVKMNILPKFLFIFQNVQF